MRLFPALLLFALLTPAGYAQFCLCSSERQHYSSVTLVEPRDSATGAIIPGLRIAVVRRYTEVPIADDRQNRWNGDTLFFRRINDSGREEFGYNYEFLFERYGVFNVRTRAVIDTVVLEDVDGEANGGRFATVRLPLIDCPSVPLCLAHLVALNCLDIVEGEHHRNHEGVVKVVNMRRLRPDECNDTPGTVPPGLSHPGILSEEGAPR